MVTVLKITVICYHSLMWLHKAVFLYFERLAIPQNVPQNVKGWKPLIWDIIGRSQFADFLKNKLKTK